MPFEFSIDTERDLILMRCTGHFTIEEMITHSLQVNDDPNFRQGMDTLSDLREAHMDDDVAALRDFLDHTTQQLEAVRGRCRWACLVADEPGKNLIWSINLVLQDRGSEIEARGFLDETEALAWLSEKRSA